MEEDEPCRAMRLEDGDLWAQDGIITYERKRKETQECFIPVFPGSVHARQS